MVENLQTTKFNDGTNIPNVTDGTDWGKLITPSYSWYDNSISNKNPYGALYNFFAVNSGKLAPKGWHVPTDAEWNTLLVFLGGEMVTGGKLKEGGTTHWRSQNDGATNESGFTALPGGNRSWNGSFYSLGDYGFWWSSTESNSASAWDRRIDRTYILPNTPVTRTAYNKVAGLSVRCIKD
jgi:uncharacterized protein (TIGR02145 family)